jgi:hypothetical protein
MIDQIRDQLNPILNSAKMRVRIAGGLVLLAAALLGWLSAGQSLTVDSAAGDERWVLPVWSSPNVAADQATLQQHRPWGQAAVSAVSADKAQAGPANFRLIGIIKRQGADLVIVSVEGGKSPEYLKKGDSLPNGAKIIAIDATSVTLEKEGGQTVRRLFRLDEVRG